MLFKVSIKLNLLVMKGIKYAILSVHRPDLIATIPSIQ
jgi:hypothetical protein